MTAYDKVMAQKLAQQQREQRAMRPRHVAQKVLRDWLGRQGMGGVIDPMAAASLVSCVEAVIVAERSGASGQAAPSDDA